MKWKKREPNTSPLGHNCYSLTQFNGKFLLFGIANGLEDPNLKKISPINHMWTFEICPKTIYGLSKLSLKGNILSSRANNIAITVKKEGIDNFIFYFW